MVLAAAFVSFRLSIRWLPKEASEPTNTVVLTSARNGIFLDVRFLKNSRELDWAFAGYRSVDPDAPSHVKFKHCIDSRTLDVVEDDGINTTLPDGTVSEIGEMVNPQTGQVTPYEEVWKDKEETCADTVLFVRNESGTKWQARTGEWQLGLGRAGNGQFWAWQAERVEGVWSVRRSTESVVEHAVKWLPEGDQSGNWHEGSMVQWEGDQWQILERGKN